MEHKFLSKTKKISLAQVNFKEYFEFYKDFIYLFKKDFTKGTLKAIFKQAGWE